MTRTQKIRTGSPWIAIGLVAGSLSLAGAAGAWRTGGDAHAASPIAAPVLEPIRGEEIATLTAPPFVPPPITRDHATRVRVELEVIEKSMRLANGVDYTFWTFGGSVPGSFIRVREGDLVELTLRNHHGSTMPHNIDLHAVTGPHGGGSVTLIGPGQESVFEFRALNPGLYVYHCATAPVGMHIANGMYGLILVEPKGGLPKVDREYYVMQGELYTPGRFGDKGHQPFDFQRALDENPAYVVFNGSADALRGERALQANVGETIRLFVGNGGPNLVSSFHVIGEIFDNVHTEGGRTTTHDVQTTLVPAGGSTIVEFRADVPGHYTLVDHSILRATNKGAMGELHVKGPDDGTIFASRVRTRPYAGSANAEN